MLGRFRHRPKCLHARAHLMFPAAVETNTINIVRFRDEGTDTEGD